MTIIATARIHLEVHDDLRTCARLAADVGGHTLNLDEEYGPFDRITDVLRCLASDFENFLEDVAEGAPDAGSTQRRMVLEFDEK